MDDLISKQATIDALIRISGFDDKIKLIERCEKSVADCEGREGGILDCISEIEDLPSAQPEQRWIPCSERLPEEEGRYLVTCSKIEWVVDWNIWRNKPKPSWLWEQGVTAWMPLPEPYREEGEQDEID